VRKPNHENTPVQKNDLGNTAYSNSEEEFSAEAPEPKGKRVVLTHYYDANLMHDVISGKLVTGVFHLMNLTPLQ